MLVSANSSSLHRFARLAGLWLLAVSVVSGADAKVATNSVPVVVKPAARSGESPALRAARRHLPKRERRYMTLPVRPLKWRPGAGKFAAQLDAAVQGFSLQAVSPPMTSFEGLSNDDNVFVYGGGVLPPDPNGDIGPNHYVQMVNLLIQVFDRGGTPLTAEPVPLNDLYAGFGGLCEDGLASDPIVLYDPLADRWMLSFIAFDVGIDPNTFEVFPVPPFHQCIACSQTSDPTGAYHLYDFQMPNSWINDYPKLAVWPDAYYMTDNQFDAATEDPHGAGVFAFDRLKMLAGDPTASYIFFDLEPLDPNIDGLLPADLDGPPPPVGTPNYMMCMTADEYDDPQGDALRLFEFHADFLNPANSTFAERLESPMTTAGFNPVMPCGASERDCISQPPPAGANSRLDALSDRLMHRLQYRNFGSNESLVVNHTVNVGGASAGTSRAAVRYYQVRRNLPGGAFGIHEQASFSPDATHRWMGSAAMDRNGNLAVGYNASSTNVFPAIRYAGRLASDPPGGLFQGETNLVAGGGSQTDTSSRWGDYSMLAVDPVDDCTFWLTAEYYSASSANGWQTRIGTFQLSACAPAPRGELRGTVTDASSSAPIAGATVITANGFLRTTSGTGAYAMGLPADTYQVKASAPGYGAKTVSGVVIANNATNTLNFALDPAPVMALVSAAASDAAGNNNGGIDPNECINLNIVLQNTGLRTASNIVAVLSTSTPGVTVAQSFSTYPDTAVGVSRTNTTPFELSVSPSFSCGALIQLWLSVTHNGGTNVIPLTLSTGSGVGSATRFDHNTPEPISFLSGGQSTITVSGISNTVAKLTVSIHIQFPEDGDLDIWLAGPDGTSVPLSLSNGGAGSNYGTGCSDANRTTFDDTAATAIGAGSPPYVGTFRPDGTLASFSGKSGGAVNGTWSLQVFNNFVEEGSIECWSLLISQPSCVPGPGGCAVQDSDGDGLPDSWEMAYFGNLGQTGGGDFDGDGMSNLAEFLSGTDPTSSASALRITSIVRTNDDLRMERSASVGTNYAAIFTATNTAAGTTNHLDAGAATNSPARFYRVRLVP
jgi:hypothetical protein